MLNVERNLLKALPHSIGDLVQLQTLNVKGRMKRLWVCVWGGRKPHSASAKPKLVVGQLHSVLLTD